MVGNVGQSPTSESNREICGKHVREISAKSQENRAKKERMRWLRIVNKRTYFRPKRGAWV